MPVNPSSYQDAIPQPTDQLSVSQGDLLNNFGALKTLIDQNHVDFTLGSPQAGKHTYVQMTLQTPNGILSPVGGFIAGETALFTGLTTAPLVTGVNEMILVKQDGTTKIPITATTSGTGGTPSHSYKWSYLPSGILMKWGLVPAPLPGVPTAQKNLITFPTGAAIPVFTTTPFVMVTVQEANATTSPFDHVIYSQQPTTTNFFVNCHDNISSTVSIYYCAIGT